MRGSTKKVTMIAMVAGLIGLSFAADTALAQPTDLAANHRNGQTFVTWNEEDAAGELYNVYRHTQRITAANIGDATLLTRRWGPLDQNTSRFLTERDDAVGSGHIPNLTPNYVIRDLEPQLSDDTGLFVWTAHEEDDFYYAVTSIRGGTEDRTDFGAGNTIGPVSERVQDPQPILARRLAVPELPDPIYVFTQYLDYSMYNPTYDVFPREEHPNGQQYAYNYAVSMPSRAGCEGQLALNIYMRGHGDRYFTAEGRDSYSERTFGGCVVFIDVDEPRQSWYFGFSRGYDYRTQVDGEYPDRDDGPIVNFTEERILRSIYDTMADPRFRIDSQRVFVYGHSMGGGGTLSMTMRYPNIFAAGFAGRPITNYRESGIWLEDVQPKWGRVADNLPVEIRAPNHWADHLSRYNGTSIWDWMNHQGQLTARRGDEMAFISLNTGTADEALAWATQGRPIYGQFYQGRRAFSGGVDTEGHSWTGFFGLIPDPMESGGPFNGWTFRCNETLPALSRATGSSGVPPADAAVSAYNTNIEWSSSWNRWDGVPVDTPGEWQVSLRSTAGAGAQTVDVTPRRAQRFQSTGGAGYSWTNTSIATGAIARGHVVADADGLIVVPGVSIDEGGSRLQIVADVPPEGGGGAAVGCSSVPVRPGPGEPPTTGGRPPGTGQPGGGQGQTQPVSQDRVRPVISNLLKARLKRGKRMMTLLKFRLSEASNVTFTLSRRVATKKCGAVKRRAKRCNRYKRVGSFKKEGKLWLNNVQLPAKISGKKLKPGRYRASLVAVDPFGNRSDTVTIAFTLK